MLDITLQKLKKRIMLRTARKKEIRDYLLRVTNALPIHDSVLRESNPIRLILQRSIQNIKKMPIIASILIAMLLGGGTSLAAQSSLPGDALYPVKVDFNEKVGGLFATTPKAKAAWEAHLAEARLQEAEKLTKDNKINVATEAEINARFKSHADNAQTIVQQLKDEGELGDAAEAASNLEVVIRSHKNIIHSLGNEGTSTTANINQELEDTAHLRKEVESEIEGHDGKGKNINNAAEARIAAADRAIADTKAVYASLQGTIATSTQATIELNLSNADALDATAKAQFASSSYANAFLSAQEAFRIAVQTKTMLVAHNEFDLKDFEGGEIEREDSHFDASSTIQHDEENGSGDNGGNDDNENSNEHNDRGAQILPFDSFGMNTSSSIRTEGERHKGKSEGKIEIKGEGEVEVHAE